MIRQWIATLKKASKFAVDDLKAAKDKKERNYIAKVFNDRYAYRIRYTSTKECFKDHTFLHKGFAWMCPSCNKVHEATKYSNFTGIEYPACCEFSEGYKWDYGIRAE